MPVEIAADGTAVFFAHIAVVIPDVPSIQYTRIDYRRIGTNAWSTGAIINAKGAQTARVGPLMPGQFYDYRAVNIGAMESTAMFLNNQLAPGDTTAPGVPSTPTIQAQHLREFTFQTTAPSDADLKDLQWQVRTSSGGGGVLVIEGTAPAIRGATSTLKVTLPSSVPYGSARWFRVRARDFSNTPTDPTAGWSTSASFSASQVVTGDFPVTPVLPPGTVTPRIRQEVVVQSFAYSVAAGVGSSNGILHTHGLGKMPTGMQAFPNNLGVTITPNTMTATTVNLNVINLTPGAQSGTASLHFW